MFQSMQTVIRAVTPPLPPASPCSLLCHQCQWVQLTKTLPCYYHILSRGETIHLHHESIHILIFWKFSNMLASHNFVWIFNPLLHPTNCCMGPLLLRTTRDKLFMISFSWVIHWSKAYDTCLLLSWETYISDTHQLSCHPNHSPNQPSEVWSCWQFQMRHWGVSG